VKQIWLNLKSGLTAAFFIALMIVSSSGFAQKSPLAIERAQIEQAIKKKGLDNNHVWHALLHLDKDQPRINDPSFILTTGAFSPYQEMLATLTFLYEGNDLAVCRFPARYLWLKTHLPLPELPISQCHDINEFIEKAPFDELYLVFASESVTQPASMMGHTFLKLSGRSGSGETREHAISFYTDADTINFPKLLWESLISGKRGVFSLTPYQQETLKYIGEEQRNLWEFKIRTTDANRALIRNHLFELRQTRLTYFLHSYNCATVLQNILGLIERPAPVGAPWTTPKDVIRQAQQSGLIESTSPYVSDTWIYAFLHAEERQHFDLPPEQELKFRENFPFRGYASPQQRFLKALNNVLLEKKQISRERWERNHADMSPTESSASEVPLEMPSQLNPALSSGDSSASISVLSRPQGISTMLSFIPASHRLGDYHHYQLAETEVQLFSGSLEITPNKTVKLHQLTVLSTQSLPPWNNVLKPISSLTSIGFGSLTNLPDDPKSLHAQLAAGITLRVRPRLDVSFLGGGGIQSRPGDSSLFIRGQISGIYRASNRTKTLLGLRQWQSPRESISSLNLQQMFYLDSGVSLQADVHATQNAGVKRQTVAIGIQKSF
jgi:hypothetical protein